MNKWLDELEDYIQELRKFAKPIGANRILWLSWELDRLIEIAKLLQEIIDDGTGSPDGKKRVWPIRAAHWREAKRLLSDEWR